MGIRNGRRGGEQLCEPSTGFSGDSYLLGSGGWGWGGLQATSVAVMIE